ncbi:MAG: hypothetical protein ACSLFH_00910 [Desulfuromonadales bacterium]
MKKHLRKTVFWGGALSTYAVLIASLLYLLHDIHPGQPSLDAKDSHVFFSGKERGPLDIDAQLNDFSGILLPLGPGDGRLPGFPAIWKEILREGYADGDRADADGFDGLQAVAGIADFSNGSVAELFLSGTPVQVFRRGAFILTLNSLGKVKIIDCQNPREPKISGLLPYEWVKGMDMQGTMAYLLLSIPGEQDKLVIADLGDPLKPREITRHNLPKETVSFLLLDRQLVVCTNTRGYQAEQTLHLYELGDGYQLVPLGSIKSSLLRNGFLKHGDYLLVPDLLAGLHVCDFSNPLQPVVVASLVFPDQVRMLARSGDMVFAHGAQNRIYAVDLHDPLAPELSAVVGDAHYTASLLWFDHYSFYFTMKGYLQVFDVSPFAYTGSGMQWPDGIVGELMAAHTGGGFALLGSRQDLLPAAVTDVLSLPAGPTVIDQLFWQRSLVVLRDDGLVQFLRKGEENSLEIQESLTLPSDQRWLAAANDRLYIGGDSIISIIAKSDDGHFVLSGQCEFPGKDSWDGLVVKQTLCVAAGKEGVLCFSLERLDQPIASPAWMIPRHLESLVDARQLASPGGDMVLVAAGSAGLVSGRIVDGGQFQSEGFFALSAPAHALAVVGDLCLVSTGEDICVFDTRTRGSLQNLGKIAFPGVEKFAVAPPDFWGGYVPGAGWFTLPAPHFVSPGETEFLDRVRTTARTEARPYRYRLNLFSDREVVTVPGVLSFSSLPGSRAAGAVDVIQ